MAIAKRKKGKAAGPLDQMFGARMRQIRMAQDISQQTLGKHLGLSFQQIQKYEQGKNRLSLSMAIRAAAFLQTNIVELVGDGNSKPAVHRFSTSVFKLAVQLERLFELSPVLAQRFRDLIEDVADNIEAKRR